MLDASGLDLTPGSYHCRVGALTTKPEKKSRKTATIWLLRKTLQKGLNTSPLLNFCASYCITQCNPVQCSQAFKRKKGAASLGVWRDSVVGRLNSKRFESQMGGFSSFLARTVFWASLSSRFGPGAIVITFESDARTTLQFTHHLEPWGFGKSNDALSYAENLVMSTCIKVGGPGSVVHSIS